MSTLAVQILLHGLIILMPVKDGAGAANHMKALLVDARTSPADFNFECFAPHHPMLKVTTLTMGECADVPGCIPNGLECICDLTRKEISLVVQPAFEPSRQLLSKQPPRSLPFSSATAGDFGYVVNLSRPPFSQTLDPAALDPVPPATLIARADFPFTSVTACALVVRRDEDGNNVYALSFRPLHESEKANEVNQAIAQEVVFNLEIPLSGTAAPQVSVAISDFGSNPKFLNLKPLSNKIVVGLMNERETLPIDSPCDDGVGRDFAFLYQVLQNPPAWAGRPIPHVKLTRWKSAKDLAVSGCLSPKTPMSRPIYPLGSINP